MKQTFYFLTFILLVSCGKKAVPVSDNKQDMNSEYSEDLSLYRPAPQFGSENSNTNSASELNQPKITSEKLYINDKIDDFLADRAQKNKAVKYANGYRIQLYVGRERKIVDDAKLFLHQTYPNMNPYLTYSLPIYKLKVGDFLTKNDAERMLTQLKPNYPDAIVISEKIDVKKSFFKE